MIRSRLLTLFSTGLALGAATLTLGCAQTLDFNECNVDTDCKAPDGSLVYCTTDHLCVGTVPEERLCPTTVEAPPGGTPLVVASLVDQTDDLDEHIEKAILLAVGEINQVTPGFGIELHRCDMGPGSDGSQSLAAVQYAFDHFGIKAVIGPTAAEDTIRVTPFVAQNGILVISPSASAVAISSLQDNDFVWRSCPSDAFEAATLAGLLARNQPTLADLLYVNNLDATGLGQSIQLAYGKTGGMFNDVLQYGDGDLTGLAGKLRLIDGDHASDAVFVVEGDAPALVADLADPTIAPNLGTTHLYFTDAAEFPAIFGTADKPVPSSVLDRIIGTAPAQPSGPTFELFRTAYKNAYNGEDPKNYSYAANAYDAVYALATAAWAKEGHGVSPAGVDLVQGMKQIVSVGTAIPVGPTTLNEALMMMQTQGMVRLEGASGPLEFDANGDLSHGAIQVWRVDTSQQPPQFVDVDASVPAGDGGAPVDGGTGG